MDLLACGCGLWINVSIWKLKFDKHVDYLCKNVTRQINIIYSFRDTFDIKERWLIYNSLILAHFNFFQSYGVTVVKVPFKYIAHLVKTAPNIFNNNQRNVPWPCDKILVLNSLFITGQ